MDQERLQTILNMVASGEMTTTNAIDALRHLPFEDLDFARIDTHRAIRQGMPEVVFCPGKTPRQIIEICRRLKEKHSIVLASRATPDVSRAVLPELPDAVFNELAATIVYGDLPDPNESLPMVAVVTAGTGDLPVAEEAVVILQTQATPVVRIADVGVAGIHRLFDNMEVLRRASAVIVIAGMDGALPSVIGGLLECPVIAVPTSVGYGASFGGVAALLTMLNSCAAGLTVCNIDNGFGAAVAAIKIVRAIASGRATRDLAPGAVS